MFKGSLSKYSVKVSSMWLNQCIREKVHIIETKYIEFPNGWLQGT